jgi:type II secretory pathway component PulF
MQAAGWGLLLLAFFVQFAALGFGFFGFWTLAGAGLIVAMLVEQQRRVQREMLLRTIATAIQRRLPLAPALDMFGREAVGWSGGAGVSLAESLEQGIPLDVALEQAGDPLGDTAGVLVRMGREVDDVHGALQTIANIEQNNNPLWKAFVARCFYLTAVVMVMVVIVSCAMIWIVPSFEKIFREFKLDLPLLTRLVITAASFFLDYGFILSPFLLIIPALPFLGLYAAWRFVGHSRADLSRTGRLGMPLHRACVMEALALAADNGRPLEPATALLAAIYPRRLVRLRLAYAHVLMVQGADWLDALRGAAVLRAGDIAALRAAQQQGNLGWTMRELAAAARRRTLQWAQTAGQIVFPLVLVGLGLTIAVIVVAMFIPLISLINSLT